LFDTSRSSAIGIVQASKLILPGLVIERKAQQRAKNSPPDLAVAVDFGAFNLRIAPYLRSLSIPVAYWFPPGSWRRTTPSERILSAADYFISPYPWYAESLREAGANADFLGHPLLDQVRPKLTRDDFMARMGLAQDSELIALLPGSRGHEVQYILPVMIEAAAILAQRQQRLTFVVPISDHYSGDEASTLVSAALRSCASKGLPKPDIALAKASTQEAICHAKAAAVCSGSATLEALIALTPMVIVYRGSKMMKLEYRLRRVNIKYMGMPNILADAPIATELRQDEATGESIASNLELLLEGEVRERQLGHLADIRKMLEPAGALDRTADALLAWFLRSQGVGRDLSTAGRSEQ